ncbi:hypothetical protein SynMINOS11_02134 [Synechococcus sp. Minos11]|nr:hypothetical protein SynMINOS11_02134 [Synechococcus sp. Minos11]
MGSILACSLLVLRLGVLAADLRLRDQVLPSDGRDTTAFKSVD